MAESVFHIGDVNKDIDSLNDKMANLIQADSFTADSSGFVNIDALQYMIVSVYATGHVLIPYIRPGATNWALRKLDDTAYTGTCYIMYIKK